MMPNLLFVYGTLMQGFSNTFAKKLRQNAIWRGRASFLGLLFDLGSYPGAIYDSQVPTRVYGEVWELTDFQKLIGVLDYYEGVHETPSEYVRRQIPVRLENGETYTCWTYLFCQPVDSFLFIPQGDYRQWLAQR